MQISFSHLIFRKGLKDKTLINSVGGVHTKLTWYNGRILAFQASDPGSIPGVSIKERTVGLWLTVDSLQPLDKV